MSMEGGEGGERARERAGGRGRERGRPRLKTTAAAADAAVISATHAVAVLGGGLKIGEGCENLDDRKLLFLPPTDILLTTANQAPKHTSRSRIRRSLVDL